MKVLAVNQTIEPEVLAVWIEHEGYYKRILLNHKDQIEMDAQVSITDYEDYQHFIAVMGKFNPWTLFVDPPYIAPDPLTFDDMEDLLMKWKKEGRKNL